MDQPAKVPEMDEWLLLCRALRDAGVPFLVVGAFGAETHFLRDANLILTHDMDLLLPPDRQTLAHALATAQQAGFDLSAASEPLVWDDVILDGVIRNGITIQAMRNEQRVDLMLSAPGLEFDELWPRAREFPMRGVVLPVAPLEAILRSKKLANRVKDRLFLEQFREVIAEALERDRKRNQRPSG